MNGLFLLRILTLTEGVSYLALLFVAMPMKYVLGVPSAVRLVGGVHGALFVAFALMLYQTHHARSWSPRASFALLAASIVPGSLFWLDRRIQELDD